MAEFTTHRPQQRRKKTRILMNLSHSNNVIKNANAAESIVCALLMHHCSSFKPSQDKIQA